MKVSVYHSIIPQPAMLKIEPSRRLRGAKGWPQGKRPSARYTPIWQVTELKTRIEVFSSAKPWVKFDCPSANVSGAIERSVNSIAKRPPKNMSSLESHTSVPICVGFGRPTAGAAAGEGRSVRVAVVTSPLCRGVRIGVPVHDEPAQRGACAPGGPGKHIAPDAASRTGTRFDPPR